MNTTTKVVLIAFAAGALGVVQSLELDAGQRQGAVVGEAVLRMLLNELLVVGDGLRLLGDNFGDDGAQRLFAHHAEALALNLGSGSLNFSRKISRPVESQEVFGDAGVNFPLVYQLDYGHERRGRNL